MNNKHKVILHLNLIEQVGPSIINFLLEKFDYNNLDQIYNFDIQDLLNLGLSSKKAKLLYSGLKDKRLLDQELELVEKNQIKITTILDGDYPESLKKIHLSPVLIYYQGDISNLQNSIALVGARKANYYGKKVVQSLISGLVNSNFVTVSGGAFGIDTFVHEETLNCIGRTIAVLGSGLLRPYPAQNTKLFNQIVASGGAVVSSFPLLFEPQAGNFPARNRIISGLSRGTVVIQAAKKSGALITANYALEQGREVFAVPGPIDDLLSEGCHKLLKDGAKLVHSVDDILTEFNFEFTSNLSGQGRTFKDVKKDPIVEVCFQPKSLEEIAEITSIDSSELQIKLFDLQLEGKIEQNFAGLWQAL